MLVELTPKLLHFTKLCGLLHFLPQPSNIFTQIYLPYLWHFANLTNTDANTEPQIPGCSSSQWPASSSSLQQKARPILRWVCSKKEPKQSWFCLKILFLVVCLEDTIFLDLFLHFHFHKKKLYFWSIFSLSFSYQGGQVVEYCCHWGSSFF